MMKRVLGLLLVVLMLLGASGDVFANESLSKLNIEIVSGGANVLPAGGSYASRTYRKQSGGYTAWNDLFNINASDGRIVNERTFDELSRKGKKQFLEDVFRIVALKVEADLPLSGPDAVTDETASDFMELLSSQSGMGTTFLATLLKDTKPNYQAAGRIFAPFNGPLGTVLALVSIVIMASLGLTSVIDLAWINISFIQVFIGGDDEKGWKSKLVSREARAAVKKAEDAQGGGSRSATWIYLKDKTVSIVVLVVCLLYLVQGELFGLIGDMVDLFSGLVD